MSEVRGRFGEPATGADPHGDEPRPPDTEGLTAEGHVLLEHLVHRSDAWCNRRAVLLEFMHERRGQWTHNVDFDFPDIHSTLLRQNPDRVLLPLFTFNKHLLPPAHVETRDETGEWLSLEESDCGRRVAYAMLLAAAERAELSGRICPDRLWVLTGSDTIAARRAWVGLAQRREEPTPARVAAPDGAVASFVILCRLFCRSMYLVLGFPVEQIGRRKIVTITHDGPIRVSRRLSEVLGIRPLVIAPRAVFGGNARSYHLQVFPPERLTVVDSRLLYSYYGPAAARPTDRRLPGPDEVEKKVRSIEEAGAGERTEPAARAPGPAPTAPQPATAAPEPAPGARQPTRRGGHWWGQVEGPADPMAAHVRCSRTRLPRLEEGRDVYGVVQLYPQFWGFVTQFLAAGLANVFFVVAFVVGLGTHVVEPMVASHPEVLFVVVVLVAGFGVSLTLYPKEHLLTSAVLRPWRTIEVLITALTIAVPLTSVSAWTDGTGGTGTTQLRAPFAALFVEAGLDVALVLLLLVASVAPLLAETTGGHRWRWTGISLRRAGFPYGRALDDVDVVTRSDDHGPRYSIWRAQRPRREGLKLDRIERRFVADYLVEERRRRLFDRGIPPAVRHDRSQRSW